VLQHPCKIQLRDFDDEDLELAKKFTLEFKSEVEEVKKGIDVYFEDVNDARAYISRLKKFLKFKIKMSTEYAGLRKGRVRVFFVYSLRGENEGILR
jgi:NMD protein affecting ribosome stability and mRNA decay